MKEALLKILKCPYCQGHNFSINCHIKIYEEWRDGYIKCVDCEKTFSLDDGIADFLADPPGEVKKERDASHREIRIRTSGGEEFRVDAESIEKFADVFTSLPKGNGSYFFRQGGSFENFTRGAHRFYDLMNKLDVKPQAKVLEIGAGFCWASREFAKRGCDVISVDISNYLKIADLYLRDGLFFERVYADMNRLPFREDLFDIIFAAATVHHSCDLSKTIKELYRVLKKSGRLILLNESFIGVFEKPMKLKDDFGFNDNFYPVPYWKSAIKKSGFENIRVTYLSFIKDYVARQETRGKSDLLFHIARAIAQHPFLDALVSFIFIPFRILFRPKSVLIQAVK